MTAYRIDLKKFVDWLDAAHIAVFDAERAHIELHARWSETHGLASATIGRRLSTICGFSTYCTEERLLDLNPAAHVRRPKQNYESSTLGLDRNELGGFLVEAGLCGGRDHALACLLALNGPRISEALGPAPAAEPAPAIPVSTTRSPLPDLERNPMVPDWHRCACLRPGDR